MTDAGKLVNCGECVRLDHGRGECNGERYPYSTSSEPCKSFSPSPLARIADALDRIVYHGAGAEGVIRTRAVSR